MSEFNATVTDIRLESQSSGVARWRVSLDETGFGVGDKGELVAVARSGARLVVPVLGIEVDDAGEMWHVVEKPLMTGTVVQGRVETVVR